MNEKLNIILNGISQYFKNGIPPEMEGNIACFEVSSDNILQVCEKFYFTENLQLKIITAVDKSYAGNHFRIYYIFGVPGENAFLAPYITLREKLEFPSITRNIHEASGYERKIKSFFGLSPAGHPSPRQILLGENWPDNIYPLRKSFNWQARPEWADHQYEFKKVEGEGIYEIPVGPVHAGIIEPGHFRFSVAGEKIILLEPKLGYKHKGIEKLFEVLPVKEKVRLSERVSGDSSFTHSLAFCQALEKLSCTEVPLRAKYLRIIFSEMERLANHLNDIGFIMLDTGYNFGGSSCSRLRESVMQLNERLTKNRFLRGVNTVGGVTINIGDEAKAYLLNMLKKIQRDFDEIIEIAQSSSSLLNRLAGTGRLDIQIAADHGVSGVAGKAAGIKYDSRIDYPYAAYEKLKFDIALETESDVHARWLIRIKEIRSSMSLIEQAILRMPSERDLKTDGEIIFKKNGHAVGIAEGWRGDIVYFVLTDAEGNISRVDVRDPSFINWTVVGHACIDNIVPDFPLINKSFNLSYSGNDL